MSQSPDPKGPDEPCVLLKLGEIVLKGRNRQQFERILQGNIRAAVRGIGVPVELRQREGVILLRVADGEQRGEPGWTQAAAQIAERVRDVPGIVRVCQPLRVVKTPEAVTAAAVALTKGRTGTFAIRARRRDKRFALTSGQLSVLIGREIVEAHGLGVNLSRPDTEVFIEVDQHEVFVFTEGVAAVGGLPVGMSGRGVALMSGGIDSPVAAYRMMRRGLRCFFLHFSGMPLTGPESIYKAYALVRGLDRFQGGSRLFVVPFGKAQQALASSGADRLLIVAQRRLMLKTGEALARRLSCSALITGDSLGQVSSQTLANLTALDDATKLPILRPLIGWDKSEIMAEARRIRTLAISELPDQDCCTLLTPRRVETRARLDDLRRIEGRLDVEDLADTLAANAQEYRQEKSLFETVSGATVRPCVLSGLASPNHISTARPASILGVGIRPTRCDISAVITAPLSHRVGSSASPVGVSGPFRPFAALIWFFRHSPVCACRGSGEGRVAGDGWGGGEGAADQGRQVSGDAG